MTCNGICSVCKNKKVEIVKETVVTKQTETNKDLAVVETEQYIVQKRLGKLIARKK